MKYLIFLVALFGFLSCDKNDTEQSGPLDVETYVEQLRKGQYEELELPPFTQEDISALLEYRDDTELITAFPVNYISSYGMSECRLGIYVLWTIESIRAVAIESEFLTGRFPSLNPTFENTDEGMIVEQTDEVQDVVAQAYYDWWYNNQPNGFETFKEVDPLENTEYRWH